MSNLLNLSHMTDLDISGILLATRIEIIIA